VWALHAYHPARMRFAFTVGFHIIFPAFSIGLAAFLGVLEGRADFTLSARICDNALFDKGAGIRLPARSKMGFTSFVWNPNTNWYYYHVAPVRPHLDNASFNQANGGNHDNRT
jgi:hypothetical protein